MTSTVIKLGGSLASSEHLPDWLDAIVARAQETPVVVVPGGGIFADHVRQQQQQTGFDDLTAHRLALLAMCQMGYYMRELCPALLPISQSDELSSHLAGGKPLLWLPLELLDDEDAMPASWDYTADSIALWLCGRLADSELILVKRQLAASDKLIDYINKGVIDKGIQLLRNTIKSNIYVLSDVQYSQIDQPGTALS